jgi:predicted TPR repeat methyltransferase
MTQASSVDSTLLKLQAIEVDIGAGRLAHAAAALNALIASAPSDPRPYLSGALLARAAKSPEQEIISLQRAVALAPGWPQAYLELAKAMSRQGGHAEALALANKAVELAPMEMSALEVGVAIANAAGDSASAQRHLEAALALMPGDIRIRRSLGICLDKQGQYSEAEGHWRAVLAQTPDDPSALGWLGTCLIGLDRKEEASALLERALALAPNHPTLSFHLAIARGETPKTQPAGMVQQMFDAYASRFDAHLVGQLKYHVPERVAQMIRERHPALDVSVLDLGCGTGLLGVQLGRIRGAFVGVDLSRNMLELAKQHDIYSKLRLNDLLGELREVAPESFDYVTANDVFVYVGDLSAIIPAAFSALRSKGALIFTCETAEESEGALVLRPSKRYAHSRSSVETLCRYAGFRGCAFETVTLRMGGKTPIEGFIAFAQK